MSNNSKPWNLGKGFYLRRGLIHYQPRQVNGVRPASFSLRTADESEALLTVQKYHERKTLVPNEVISTEIKRHLADGYLKATAGGRFRRVIYSDCSIRAKRAVLGKFLRALPPGRRLKDVKTSDVQRWYDGLHRCSPETKHKQLMDLQALFTWALHLKKIHENPARTVIEEDFKSVIQRVNNWCPPGLRDQLINNCVREDLRLALMLGFHAGMRKNEIIEARREWFDLTRQLITMQDTYTKHFTAEKKGRALPIKPVLLDHLKKHGMSEPFLLRPDKRSKRKKMYRWDFTIPFKQYLATQTWTDEDGEIRKCSEMNITAHTMRHTYASLYIQGGEPIANVAAWLGDSIAVTISHYMHLTPRGSHADRSL